jgi:hypothetical protein
MAVSTLPNPAGVPAALGASNTSTSGFTANWSAVTGATGYRVDVAIDVGFSSFVGAYNNLDVGNVTSCSVGGLTPNTSYYYRVRAVVAGTTSANSNIMTAVTLPLAPTALAGSSATTGGFTANWSTVTGATGCRLDVATDIGFSSLVGTYNNLDVGNVTSYAVSGLTPNTPYYYRVRAVGPGGTSGNSNTVTVTTTETTPPSVSVPSVSGGTAGQSVIVSAQITDNSGVASAALYYRKSGESGFTPTGMTGTGGSYQGTIPGGAVTSSGVDYYVKAVDLNGNVGRFPPTGWSSVQVLITGGGLVKGTPQGGGSLQTAYRLVSIPLQADQNDVGSVLGDDLGEYTNTQWRLYELKADQTPGECSKSTPMPPGKGFWLITKESGKVIDTGPGKSVPTSPPYGISLHAGWNLVGNPYAFSIPVGKLTLANSEAVVLRSYEGAWNNTIMDSVTMMEPFVGYALHTGNATTLNVNADLSTGVLPKATIPEIAWWVVIEGRCGDARDVDNVALVAEGASREKDGLDMREPPVIGEYVTVRFPHPEWEGHAGEYCVDARPDVDRGGEVWEFEVRTASPKPVELKFSSLERVPPQYQIWLVDEAVHERQDIRTKPAYEFAGPGEGKARRFALIVGEATEVQKLMATKGLVPAAFELLPNFPNPFNPGTSIPFGLPAKSHVRLGVYTLLGQEVAVLVDRIMAEGYHTVEFDARDRASGIYFVRMSAEGVDGARQAFTTTRKIVLMK